MKFLSLLEELMEIWMLLIFSGKVIKSTDAHDIQVL